MAQMDRLRPLIPHSDYSTARQPMRRLNQYTFAPNGWLHSVPRDGTDIWGTQFLTVGCPDDFYALRLGFPNITQSAYIVPRITVCASSTWNDYANPTGNLSPVTLTTVYAGNDINRIVTRRDAATTLTVTPNSVDLSSGEPTVPAWSWTDWCHVTSGPPEPKTGMRVLMIRHTILNNKGAPVTYCNGAFLGWTGNSDMNKGYDYFCGGIKGGQDLTDFRRVDAAMLPVNSLINGSFVCAVQFLTKNAGIIGMAAGDSHHQGTSTTTDFNSYLAQLMTSMGQAYIGAIPFGWANCAVAGAVSQQFFPCLNALIGHINPSFVILPGWTANEMNGSTQADHVANMQFFSRLLQTADVVRMNGAIPIWLTPFPRDRSFMTPPRLSGWQYMRQIILSMKKQGEIVVDATAALGNLQSSEFDGTYIPTMTTDDIHPNDLGHAAVAALLRPVIKALLT